MGRSQKWPDLRSPISKIRDIRFVGTGNLIIFRKFHNFPWNVVAVARLEIYFVVGSLDLTWWPDLTWHWVEIFTKVAEKMGGKVGENPAALRAAVFSLSSKNLRGGGAFKRPPSRARVKGRVSTDIGNMELWARGWSIYFSELTVSFKPQGKFFNSLYFEHPWAESAMTYYRLHPKHISQHYKQKRKPQQRYYR